MPYSSIVYSVTAVRQGYDLYNHIHAGGKPCKALACTLHCIADSLCKLLGMHEYDYKGQNLAVTLYYTGVGHSPSLSIIYTLDHSDNAYKQSCELIISQTFTFNELSQYLVASAAASCCVTLKLMKNR